MKQYSVILIACIVLFASILTGCSSREEYNTQRFGAGGATCLGGKQLYFISYFSEGKSAPYAHYQRFVFEQTTLPVDPTNHQIIDFSQADPFELRLPNDLEFGYYHDFFGALYIGSDGTISVGTPGTGNNTLLDCFNSDQISLLPVDATVEGAVVRYAINDDKFVVTYENIAGNTFQCELFFRPEQRSDIRVTYPAVSENTRDGVVGVPDRFHGAIEISVGIEGFIASRFTDSNLCEDSLLNFLEAPDF